MHDITAQPVQCPSCGEMFDLLVDGSVPRQEYVEDCEVCCRPICFTVSVSDRGEVFVVAKPENE